MSQKIQTKIKSDLVLISSKMIQALIDELHLLKEEVMLILPQDDLEDYAHPERIKKSYKKAVKKYSPSSL